MRPIFKILLFLTILPVSAFAQSYLEVVQEATFLMHDSSTRVATVDARLLLTKNTLQFVEQPTTPWKLADVHKLRIDTTEYFVNKLVNIRDTVKVMERVIKGKINYFISPRLSTSQELFVQKDNAVYELRIVRKYVDGRTFEVKEYTSYLKHVTMDCKSIDQVKLVNDVALSYPAILKLITRYNNACGWQEQVTNKKQDLKSKLTLGIMAGAVRMANKLSYDKSGILEGKRTLTGFYAGPSIALEFRKFNDTRVSYDILIEKSTGTGRASASNRNYSEIHDYEILNIKHIIAANVSVSRNHDSHVFVGSGIAVHHQVKNHTTWRPSTGGKPRDPFMYHSGKDKFNMSPFAHVHFGFGRFGFRYQAIALSIQMKKIEVFGFEHRLSLHYDIKN
ncbi:MAG TPA: hypothetical protein VD927_19260 [Chryseosolibacter sp.]|nr:hypothetical protein [Chryseosolibacter sp.]